MNLILAWKIVETQVQYNISALVHKLDKREKDAFGKECIKKNPGKKGKKGWGTKVLPRTFIIFLNLS